MKRISTLYDQGSAEEKEDGLLYRPPFYGVIDGVTSVYNSEHPKRLFDGKSGGAMVTQNIIDNFSVCRDDLSLEKMIVIANTVVKMVQLEAGVSFENSSQLAGATFAFVKINEKNIEIIQAGDSMALLLLKDGSIIMTPNQVLAHDTIADGRINEIQKKYREEGLKLDEAREKAWIEIYDMLSEMK